MVQRKVLSKIGIQADHVTCDKNLENMKLYSSQNQDGKNKGRGRNKKMKKSRLIKLTNVEALQSQPLHVPTTAASLQKHKPLVGTTTDNSPNYMRPTRSSDAKKEISLVRFQNTKSEKNLQQKCSVSSKAGLVSCKKPEKSLTRLSSSLNLVRSLTKGLSFKPSRTCPRKSSAAPERHTCSSTLKDSKFPAYLMLNPRGTESEGTSVMNVCPYRYCSLNGHHHAPLPPLKSFVLAKRRIMKTQRSMKLEPLSPLRLKMPCDTKNIDIEQNVLEQSHDEVDDGNPLITPLAKEIGEDFFIEIHVKGNGEVDGMGKFDSAKDLEDQDNIEFSIDENSLADEEDGVKQVNPSVNHDFPKCEINHEEHMENIELNGFDPKETEMEHEDNIDTSVFTEETVSNFESLLESSYDVSVICSDDTHSSHQADILVEAPLKEADREECTCFEAQPNGTDTVLEAASEKMEFETKETGYLSNGTSLDQSPPTEEVLQHLIGAEGNDGESEKHVNNEAGCTATKVLDEEIVDNTSQGHKMSETSEVDDNHKEGETSLQNKDGRICQENLIHSSDGDQGKTTKLRNTGCKGCEYQKNTSNNWQRTTKRKRPLQDDEEMRWINPRKPKFLPLVPESESEKINLRHQMMDERKNAEEWMLDFALRQAVIQLAPARKRKVALLVEAFETVMPIPKCESHMRSSSRFAHARPMQACS